jgi:hypothetical protein
VYWEIFGSNAADVGPGNGTEILYSSNTSSINNVNFAKKGVFDYYWVGVNPSGYPSIENNTSVASVALKTNRYSSSSS